MSIKIEIDWGSKNPEDPEDMVVIVHFEEDSNFNSKEARWVPREEELRRILIAMKKVTGKSVAEILSPKKRKRQ